MHTVKRSFPLTPVADTGPLASGKSDAAHAVVSEPSHLGLKQNKAGKEKANCVLVSFVLWVSVSGPNSG